MFRGQEVEDVLLELAGRIEPDGGLPGSTPQERIVASLLVLLLLASEGHVRRGRPFSHHVRRLLAFLDSADLSCLDEPSRRKVAWALAKIEEGEPPRGEWLSLARRYLREGRLPAERVLAELPGPDA